MNKILIVNETQKSIDTLNVIIEQYTKYDIEINDNVEEIIVNYKNDNYEFIIFDHSFEGSDRIMDFVLSRNPNQKAILLSDSLLCPISCDFCLNNFKFVRLLKPVNAIDVLNYINNNCSFECPNKYRFENIDTLDKLYEFINLEDNSYFRKKELDDKRIIIKNTQLGNIRVKELEKIQNLINENFFNININTNDNIIITKK